MAKTTHGLDVTVGGVTLAGVTSFTPPEMTRGTVDVTDHDSTTAKDYLAEDLYELGDSTVTMNYVAGSATDDACIAAITAAPGSPVAVTMTVKSSGGTETISFSAYGTGYQLSELPAGSAAKQSATLTLKPTGAKSQA